ncbi:glycosyltransferase family 2 protein [bacterium]|nr:MAG: glycosyltransferase family 2 protein [bacterium]
MDVMDKNKNGKAIGFIMTYNCSAFLENVYNRIPKVLDEIIVVDDDSSDRAETERIARKLNIPFFSHEHMGYGGNLRYGLKKALERGGDYMFEIHGDGQFDPSVIPVALQKMRGEYDLVLGSRFLDGFFQPLRDGMPLLKYLANIGLSFIDRLILGVPLSEFHNGLRVCSKKLVQKLPFEGTSDNYLYGFEIIAQAAYFNLKIGEVPIRADYRKGHTSISIWKSTIYAFQTFGTLFLFIVARSGFKIPLFQSKI